MGAGPDALAPAIATMLRAADVTVTGETIESPSAFGAEISTSFALLRELATCVDRTCARGAFPLVLSGNCGTANATVSALRAHGDDVGVIWFDAHGDLETPETSTSGFLDGMGLATLIGACWRALASSIPGVRPLPGHRVVLAGARDLSDAEHALIRAAGIHWLTVDALRGGVEQVFAPVLETLRAGGVSRAYVHVDLDVHDPSAARINTYQPPGGLTADEVRRAVRAIASRFEIAGGALTAYDPACDPEGRALPLAADLATALLQGRR